MSKSLYTTIKETTAPTTATVGIVGQKYLDTTTKKYYICTAIDTSSSTYTWEELAKQSSVDNKLDTTGGTVTGNIAIQGNLTVTGETTTEKQKTLEVEDNFIYTNANKVELTALLSGIAIYKNGTDIYAIAYDPATDSVKLGLGTRDAQGVFHFNTGEGSPVAVRADSADLTDNHIIVWDATNHKFIDSGKSIEDLLTLINSLQTNLTTEITNRMTEDTNLQTQITNIDTTISSYGNVVTHNINEFASAESLTTKADVNASNLTSTNVTNWKNKLNVQSDIFSRTTLWSGNKNTNGTISLHEAYSNFYKILFTFRNESGENVETELFSDTFQNATQVNPYNLPFFHSDRARYINIYPQSSTILDIHEINNLTLYGIYGVCRIINNQ